MIDTAERDTLPTVDHLAAEMLSALADRRQIAPLTARYAGLPLDAAYGIAAAVRQAREARGERVVGRKIGFTNRTIWDEYNVHAPIWGYVFDSTLHRLEDLDGGFDISGVIEPRIEPEIAFRLGRAPEPGMTERALLDCIEWVAQGFEVVQSLFPGWRFQAADTVAAFGLHAALLLGPQHPITEANSEFWYQRLAAFDITLTCDGVDADHGNAANVLGGGPLSALCHLVEVLAKDLDSPPLAAGEIVTTGTLTRALPIAPGQTWSTRIEGLPLAGISVNFVSSRDIAEAA
jgi:2-oxo-3-hexenedioate decarboxylase